jgi:small-conductance mechanosensitive channel
MVKHRELAGVVYASTLGRSSAAAIWRTVVFAGAMLGAPLASADTPGKKPAPTKAAGTSDVQALDRKIEAAITAVTNAKTEAERNAAKTKLQALQKERAALNPKPAAATADAELKELDVKIAKAVDAVAASQSEADRKAATAKLEALQSERAAVDARVKASAAVMAVEKLQRELAGLDVRTSTAIDAVTAAQTDADRQAAKAKLDALKKERAALEAQLAAEKAKVEAAKRPRAKRDERPVGRGFVLA